MLFTVGKYPLHFDEGPSPGNLAFCAFSLLLDYFCNLNYFFCNLKLRK